jgi:hypothetical protein
VPMTTKRGSQHSFETIHTDVQKEPTALMQWSEGRCPTCNTSTALRRPAALDWALDRSMPLSTWAHMHTPPQFLVMDDGQHGCSF